MPAARQMVEIKRTLDGRILEYPAEPLVVDRDKRAVILCRIDALEQVAGGRMTLAPGTLSFGYFWFDRPYNVYHWVYAGETLVYYINVGRLFSIGETELVWDDYAVDILAFPDGTVEVLDEDEVPGATDQSIREFITDATSRVLATLDSIVDSVERETRVLRSTVELGSAELRSGDDAPRTL